MGKHTARMSTERGTNPGFGLVDLTHVRARTTLNGSAEASIDPRPAECPVAVCANPGDDRAHDPCVDVRIFRPRLHLRSRSRSRYVPYAPYADRCDPVPVARDPERFGHCVVIARAADVADDLRCGVSRRRRTVYDSLFFNGESGLNRPATTATTPQLGFTTEAAHLAETNRFLAPMDQTHTLTSGLTYNDARTRLWGGVALEYGSGTPGGHGGDDAHEEGETHEHATGPGLCGTRCLSHFTQNLSIGWNATADASRPHLSVQYREAVEQSVCAVEREHDGGGAVLDSASRVRVGKTALLNSVS